MHCNQLNPGANSWNALMVWWMPTNEWEKHLALYSPKPPYSTAVFREVMATTGRILLLSYCLFINEYDTEIHCKRMWGSKIKGARMKSTIIYIVDIWDQLDLLWPAFLVKNRGEEIFTSSVMWVCSGCFYLLGQIFQSLIHSSRRAAEFILFHDQCLRYGSARDCFHIFPDLASPALWKFPRTTY